MTTFRSAAFAATAAFALGAAALQGAAAPAQAQARGQAPAAKPKPKPKQIFPYWENYLRIPAAERTRFHLVYTLKMGGKPGASLPLYAVDGARREQIAVGPDGRMRPPALDFFRSKTAVIDMPGASGQSFNINMELLAAAQPAREMDAAELTAAINQSNAGIRKAAGLIGVVAPKMGRVRFEGARSGEAVLADGGRTPLPTLNGAPYFAPAAMPSARRLVFAAAPDKLQIGPAPKPAKGS
jgi:hypothetical protein